MTVSHLLEQIRSDNQSGSAEILRYAARVFTELAAEKPEDCRSVEAARRLVFDLCVDLVRAQPSMAPLIGLSNAVIHAAKQAPNAGAVLDSTADAAAAFHLRVCRAVNDVVAHVAEFIAEGATVLTHSRSSTVLNALLQLNRMGRRFRVIATESRPMFEGRVLSQALAQEGVNVTLVVDAAAASVIEQATCFIVGADRVTPNAVLNKVGTRMIALAAHERGVPVLAATDTSKFVAVEAVGSESQQRPADEVWHAAPIGVLVVNLYFEKTPIDHFNAIITENGITGADEVRQLAKSSQIDPLFLDSVNRD